MGRIFKYVILYCALIGAAIAPVQAFAQDWSCNRRPTCTKMKSCAEADFYFRQCGHFERDGDNDGIPCEALCGDTMQLYQQRRVQQNGQSQQVDAIVRQFLPEAG